MAPIATLHSSRLSAILWGVALSFDTGHATGSHSLSDDVTLPKHTDGFRGVYLGWKEEAKLLIFMHWLLHLPKTSYAQFSDRRTAWLEFH